MTQRSLIQKLQRSHSVRCGLVLGLSVGASVWVLGGNLNLAWGQTSSIEAQLIAYLQQLSNNPVIQGNGQIVGTNGNNKIIGSAQGDTIYGDGATPTTGGNDLIYAKGSVDTVMAGPGNDILFGDDGEVGVNTFYGGSGCTFVLECDDKLWGQDGNDWVVGEGGNDFLAGGQAVGAPNASAINNNDADVLLGGDHDDKLIGGYGDDRLVGGLDNDLIIGAAQSTTPADHAYDGIDILWGDGENGSGSTGVDTFVLGADGVRYYDDNLPFSNGTINRAVIKDFNSNRGDRIQLAQLPPQPPIGSVARYYTANASTVIPGAPGVAILYTTGVSGQQPELLAIVENVTSLDLSAMGGQVIYN